MAKEILITGRSGYVMSNVLDGWWDRKELNVHAPTHNELDFTDLDSVESYIKWTGCKVFIHGGAYTNVSKARKEYDLAKAINGVGTQNVAMACEKARIKMVLLSTDYVFPGDIRNPGPYKEDSRRPESFTSLKLGAYASTKLLSELIAQKYSSNLAIVRLSYPYGCPNDKDYVVKLLGKIQNGKELFMDQHLTPTYLPDLSDALRVIVNKDKSGIFHVASPDTVTPYEMGKYVVDKLGLDLKVRDASCGEYLLGMSVEPIPQFGGLNSQETRKKLKLEFHSWNEGVDEELCLLQSSISL